VADDSRADSGKRVASSIRYASEFASKKLGLDAATETGLEKVRGGAKGDGSKRRVAIDCLLAEESGTLDERRRVEGFRRLARAAAPARGRGGSYSIPGGRAAAIGPAVPILPCGAGAGDRYSCSATLRSDRWLVHPIRTPS